MIKWRRMSGCAGSGVGRHMLKGFYSCTLGFSPHLVLTCTRPSWSSMPMFFNSGFVSLSPLRSMSQPILPPPHTQTLLLPVPPSGRALPGKHVFPEEFQSSQNWCTEASAMLCIPVRLSWVGLFCLKVLCCLLYLSPSFPRVISGCSQTCHFQPERLAHSSMMPGRALPGEKSPDPHPSKARRWSSWERMRLFLSLSRF